MSLVDVKNLSIRFGKNEVVRDVSFSVEAGEILAIVGESGSGKSLTAASIGGLLPSNAEISGEILFNNLDINKASDREKRAIRGNDISYVFQEPMSALNPLHRIEKQVAEGMELHQGLRGEKLHDGVVEILGQVGLNDHERFLPALPHQLSGGQRQRVCIAMALANNPKCLVADEPTTALDATVEKQVLDLLRAKHKALGYGMIFITHDLRLLENFVDRVMVMQHGRVVEIGTVEQVLQNPKDPYTRALIDAGEFEPRGVMKTRPKPLLNAKSLSVTYGKPKTLFSKSTEFEALKPLDLQLGAGESIGLVGESGSGKSTLGLALMRLIPTKGEVELNGEILSADKKSALRAARRNIQMVFQDPYGSLSPRMTIGDIIGEGLKVHYPKMDRQSEIAKIMEEVELDPKHANRYPHEFSGGQRQRIAIARALILKPKLLILDEPTSALDRTVQKQIVELLIRLQDRYEMGYIFISHDLSVVRAMCHRVIVLKNGEIMEEGVTTQIYDKPQNDYTKLLIEAAL